MPGKVLIKVRTFGQGLQISLGMPHMSFPGHCTAPKQHTAIWRGSNRIETKIGQDLVGVGQDVLLLRDRALGIDEEDAGLFPVSAGQLRASERDRFAVLRFGEVKGLQSVQPKGEVPCTVLRYFGLLTEKLFDSKKVFLCN